MHSEADHPPRTDDQNRAQEQTSNEAGGVILQGTPIATQTQSQNSDNEHNSPAEKGNPSSPFKSWVRSHWEKAKHVGFHEWLMLLATIAMAGSTIVYTHYAREQLATMQGQLNQMTTDSRPWIKITDIELTQESFATFDFPKAMPIPIEDHGVTLRVKIKVKNVGHGVARSIVIRPLLIFERLMDTKEALLKSQEECVRSVGPSAPEGFTFSSVFPEEYREQSWVALGVFAQSDINAVSGKSGKYLIADLVTCVGYQYPMPYLTRAAAHIMSDKDRFLEVGVPLRPPNIRLLRDDHFEYAQ